MLFGLLCQFRETSPMNDWIRLLASGILGAVAGALAFVAVAAKLARAASFGEKQEVLSVRTGAKRWREEPVAPRQPIERAKSRGGEGAVNPVVHVGHRAEVHRQNRIEITPKGA